MARSKHTRTERLETKHYADEDRIFENQHLLDATEIFRKLNVHKKVRKPVTDVLTVSFRAVEPGLVIVT